MVGFRLDPEPLCSGHPVERAVPVVEEIEELAFE